MVKILAVVFGISLSVGILFSWGCSAGADNRATTGEDGVTAEEYARWNPDNALTEAQCDIENGTVKVYYGGCAAPLPIGALEDYDLIKDLPKADAGVGPVRDVKLSKLQSQYATIYNKAIVRWIKANKSK